MSHIRRAVCFLAIMVFVAGLGAVSLAEAQSGNPQKNCPVLGGPITKDSFADYNGKRVYFCCPGCSGDFNKDPEKYMKKLDEQGVTPEASPKN